MKSIPLFISFLFLILFNACKKGDSIEKEDDSDQTLAQTPMKVKIDTAKTKQHFQELLSMVKSGQINFEEFRSSVKLILNPFKTLVKAKSLSGDSELDNSLVNARHPGCPSDPFDPCQWTFTPPPCNISPPEDCDAFYTTECLSQCNDAYMYAGDVFYASEQAADLEYQQALENCNPILDPAQRLICITLAQNAYSSAMGVVLSCYFNAYGLWGICEDDCP